MEKDAVNESQFRKLFPNASRSTIEANRELCHPELEQNKASALEQSTSRKTYGMADVKIRFTGYRTRPLDPDNFAGSIKDLLDGLRHAALIPGDEPWLIKLETDQVKVAHRKDERTEIEIIYP